jgi:hypothetical protein
MTGETPSRIRTNEILFFYGGLVFVAILISIAGLLYRNGYRLESFSITKVGNLEVAVYESGARVFIDNKLQKITEAQEEVIQFNDLSPGNHTVAIEKEGFYPWKKDVPVTQFNTAKISSFLFPTETSLTEITDPKAKGEAALFFADATASSTEKRTMGDTVLLRDNGSLSITWIGDNQSIPEYFCGKDGNCSTGPISIFSSSEKIRNANFYKNREDVFLAASGTDITILEIQADGTIDTHTLYKGKAPTFYENGDNTLYIKDGANIFTFVL